MFRAFLLFLSFSALANPDPTSYAPSTLRALFNNVEKANVLVGRGTADYFPVMSSFTVMAEYTGESRPIAGNRARFIAEYALMRRQPDLKAAYQREIRVKDDTSLYWIPVQEAYFDDFAKELKRGQRFVAFVGVAGKTLDREPMVLMMDFSSEKSDLETLQKALQQKRPKAPNN